jgi:coenzyme Q-binding protein COQ10
MFKRSPLSVYNSLIDIDKYSEFIPWITASRLKKSAADQLIADLTIGFPPITQSNSYNIYAVCPYSILSMSEANHVFEQLESRWELSPDPLSLRGQGPVVDVAGCEARYSVKFKFTSVFYQQFASLVFDSVCTRTAEAFLRRINSLPVNLPVKYDKDLKEFIQI